MTQIVNKSSYRVIDHCEGLDYRLYKDLGLDPSALTDSSPDALIPTLREAATDYLTWPEPTTLNLLKAAHNKVQIEMLGVLGRFRAHVPHHEDLVSHTAVNGFVLRNGEQVEDTVALRERLRRIGMIGLDLARPVHVGQDLLAFTGDHQFVPITLPQGRRYDPGSPESVAGQLTEATVRAFIPPAYAGGLATRLL